jgi:hypothetical protein
MRSHAHHRTPAHLVVCWCLAALGAVAAVARAAAHQVEEPKVRIGPGLLTFGQLADALSVPGRRVQCLRALRDRAAFVSLKERPWSEAVAIVSAALDVKVVEEEPKVWVMQRDPQVRDREQRWFDRWTSNMYSELREKLKPFAPYRGKAYRSVKLQIDAWYDECAQLHESDPGLKSTRGQELRRLLEPFRQVEGSGDWLTAELFRTGAVNAQTIREAAARGGVVKAAPTASLFGDVSWLREGREPEPPAGPDKDLAVWALELGQDGLSLRTRIFLVAASGKTLPFDGKGTQSLLGVWELFRAPDVKAGAGRWPGLGEEAAAWLDRERAVTQMFLHSDAASKSFTLQGDRRITSLSQVVEAWSKELDSEAVMELWPMREGFHHPSIRARVELAPGKQMSLTTVFAESEKPKDPNENDDAHAWTLRQDHGVLVVKNRLAFADRKREYPMAAFLALEKRAVSGMYRDLYLVDTVGIEDIEAYCKATTPEASEAWAHLADKVPRDQHREVCPRARRPGALGEPSARRAEGVADPREATRPPDIHRSHEPLRRRGTDPVRDCHARLRRALPSDMASGLRAVSALLRASRQALALVPRQRPGGRPGLGRRARQPHGRRPLRRRGRSAAASRAYRNRSGGNAAGAKIAGEGHGVME